MLTYFELLSSFFLLFALIYVLAHLPGVHFIKNRIKENLVFLLSFTLLALWHLIGRTGHLGGYTGLSYLCSFGFIFLLFNGYLLFSNRIKRMRTAWNILIDFMWCALTIFVSACIVALLNDFPVMDVIYERFDNGDYLFSPGNLTYMISSSIGFSLLIIPVKYIHLYLLHQLEKRQKEKILLLKLQKKNIEVQFAALQSKINPHFLYNALNTIAGMATVNGEKTRQIALSLSRFFRYSINREEEMVIPLEEEAAMMETYLKIEKIRFDDQLTYHIDMPDDTRRVKIPRMLLQPIVENCVKHGMKGDGSVLKINITFSLAGHTLIILIKDNGAAFPKDIIPGYGIQSVYDKLDMLFPNRYDIALITSPEKEFRICLHTAG